MKKHVPILILIIISLLLSACSIDWNDSKDKKITELEKQIIDLKEKNNDYLFQKKQECQKYASEMLNLAKEYRSEIYELEEIFYSPLEKSCFFIWKEWIASRNLFDYLGRKYIAGYARDRCFDLYNDKNEYGNCIEQENRSEIQYQNQIIKLKWE
jgi:hypothetical protein